MRLVRDRNAWGDYLWWQTHGRKGLKRIDLLVEDVVRHGNESIGMPEALEHDSAGCWSRRIAACRYHDGR